MGHINLNLAKVTILGILAAIVTAISSLFGGWDSALTTLIIFMIIDYIAGLIVAGVFKRSKKSETGALESRAGWKGLYKKGMTLLIVLIAVRLDIAVGTTFIKDVVVIAYIANEALSIIENAGLMGLPIPTIISRAIEVLRKKEVDSNEQFQNHIT